MSSFMKSSGGGGDEFALRRIENLNILKVTSNSTLGVI